MRSCARSRAGCRPNRAILWTMACPAASLAKGCPFPGLRESLVSPDFAGCCHVVPVSPRGSWFRWAVAGRAVKVAATLGLDKIKAFGKFIHVYVPSGLVRKPGCAGLSANGTPKVFNPAVWGDHRSTMSLRRDGSSQLGCHNQTDPTAWSFDEAHPPNG